MKRLVAYLILCQFWSIAFVLQSNVTFYVSRQGKDSNPSTIEKPFATPARAKDVVREQLVFWQNPDRWSPVKINN